MDLHGLLQRYLYLSSIQFSIVYVATVPSKLSEFVLTTALQLDVSAANVVSIFLLFASCCLRMTNNYLYSTVCVTFFLITLHVSTLMGHLEVFSVTRN
jgi:hypothetical protein